jgi:hypothetical protein
VCPHPTNHSALSSVLGVQPMLCVWHKITGAGGPAGVKLWTAGGVRVLLGTASQIVHQTRAMGGDLVRCMDFWAGCML